MVVRFFADHVALHQFDLLSVAAVDLFELHACAEDIYATIWLSIRFCICSWR
jgi:hypothetical protein